MAEHRSGPGAPQRPRVTLTNPDAPTASVSVGVTFDWPRGGRWEKVDVRRDDYGAVWLVAWAGRTPLRLVADDLADLEANVEDLVRALAAFSVELAKEAPEAGGESTSPAGPVPETPEGGQS